MFDRRVEGCPCGTRTRPGQLSGNFQAAKVAACRRLYRPEPILGGFRFRFVFSCFLVNARFCLWWVGKQVGSMKTDVENFCTVVFGMWAPACQVHITSSLETSLFNSDFQYSSLFQMYRVTGMYLSSPSFALTETDLKVESGMCAALKPWPQIDWI